MAGLLVYLAGPGRANEHTEPHLVAGDSSVMAWHDDDELNRDSALQIARQLDQPRRVFDVEVPGGHVWHCSLSLRAGEGQLTDQKWSAIAYDFVERMGFTSPEAGKSGDEASDDGPAPCRWVAVRHGLSAAGNDHIHIAVSLVREDGTKASVHHDWGRAQKAAGELERTYGLEVLQSRDAGTGMRGLKPGEIEKAKRVGAPEPARVALARVARGCAVAAGDEAEFVRRLRRAGVLARPRYAAGRTDVVAGYSVAQRPEPGVRPIWYGGGHLARDLSLPRLRAGWPDSPQQAAAAVGEWTAAKRNRRVVAAGREVHEPDPALWRRYAAEIGDLRQRMTAVSPQDRAAWARVAHETSGAFAAWSIQVESVPGPLAAAADALSRSAQTRGPGQAAEVVPRPGVPSVKGAALLLASAVRGGRGTVGEAVLLRQLAHAAIAIYRAHVAVQESQRARDLVGVLNRQLIEIREALPPVPTHGAEATPVVEDIEAAAAAQTARQGQSAPEPGRQPGGQPGPAVPNPLQRPAARTRTSDRDIDVGR